MNIDSKVLSVLKQLDIFDSISEDKIMTMNFLDLFDSIMFVTLIIKLEDEFTIEIVEENLLINKFSSFDNIVQLIKSLKGN